MLHRRVRWTARTLGALLVALAAVLVALRG